MDIKKRLVAAFLLIAALTGCAAESIQRDFSFKSEPDKGIVVFSVSHDLAGKRGVGAFFYMDSGTSGENIFNSVEPIAPGVPVPRSSQFEDSYGHVLVLALAPGKHAIDSWKINNTTGLLSYPEMRPTPLVFEVISGQVKYLGNLHANVQVGKGLFGIPFIQNGYPEIRDQQQRDIPIFEKEYPQFKGKIKVDLLHLGPWK